MISHSIITYMSVPNMKGITGSLHVCHQPILLGNLPLTESVFAREYSSSIAVLFVLVAFHYIVFE